MCGVQGLGCRLRVEGFGYIVEGVGCRVYCAGCRVQGEGFRAQSVGFGVGGLGGQINGLGFRVGGVVRDRGFEFDRDFVQRERGEAVLHDRSIYSTNVYKMLFYND